MREQKMRKRAIKERISISVFSFLLVISLLTGMDAPEYAKAANDISYARSFIEGELFDQSYYYDTGTLPGENEDSGQDSADDSAGISGEARQNGEASTAQTQEESTSDTDYSASDTQDSSAAGETDDTGEGENDSSQNSSDSGDSSDTDIVIAGDDTAGEESETEVSEEMETTDWQGLLQGVILPTQSDDSWFTRSVVGATGWNTIELTLKADASSSATSVGTIAAGTAFCIDEEDGDWWRVVLSDGGTGYIEHCYCMINLPDVLPAMEYDIKNAYSAIYRSCSYDIDGVTGEKLYSAGTLETDGKVWNERLGRYEYLVPVMYSTAKKISIAQYNAYTLTGGQYTLKIYDSYRPHSVTIKIASALSSLYASNSTVQKQVDYSTEPNGATYSWGYSWFLAQSLSTHNTGSAIDVTLCQYNAERGAYEEMVMQTVMHELSTAAIKYYSGSVSKTPANYSSAMNDNAKLLDAIFIGGTYGEYSFQDTGMATLASEWWHFQDNETHSRVRGYTSSGCDFQVTDCLSK
ncbi:MAG: hypothetical protein LUI13_11450 [Lachnospiraceae bacterium]|nr:hypothetical protein [Lachnospiraceae bacterium]